MIGGGSSPERPMPIAIVGIGCRFPGGIVDTETFWRVLADGVDAISEIPADRFDVAKYYDERPGTRGRIMTKWGGFVNQRLEEFDAAFFGISRSYAERLDPQQRLLLETSWEAMEDAGIDIVGLRGTPTGVFVGQWVSDFEHRLFADPSGIDFQMAMGSGRYAAAGRLSYAFGFRGPSLSIDAACSSGLASVHLAVRSLRSGDSEIALAGGVNMILQPHIHLAYSYSRMMAADGRCRFGDARGSGYVRSEGAGIVVLKPLAAAVAAGDRIYAVIRGSAVNSDGDSSGSMGRPSRLGQEELLRSALRDGNVLASQLDYVEAHGTGTRAGDPVELAALGAVLSEGRAANAPRVWVGSVKTNIGHTEAAAGVAGLIKTALMLERGQIPASLHFDEPNREVAWQDIPLAIPTGMMVWPRRDGMRVAGVSSYGIGGTNAHVVLESAPAVVGNSAAHHRVANPIALLPLSARGVPALRAMAARYADLLSNTDGPLLHDVCWSAATRRSALTHRAAFVATDRESMVSALRAFAAGDAATADGVVHEPRRRRIAFVVPGQGAQWVGMARELAAAAPVFRDTLAACDAAARTHTGWSIVEQLHLDVEAAGYRGDRIDVIQPTLVAIAIAYAAWLRSLGIEPDAVVGHSLGEVGAAAISGALDVQTAMRIIVQRSALMQRTSGHGAMAVVELPSQDVTQRLRGREAELCLAVSNSPRSSVISGTPAAVGAMLAELQVEGVFCRLVKVDVASHSPQMNPLATELVDALADIRPSVGSVPIYSTVQAAPLEGTSFDAAYWGRNLTHPVLFGDTVERMLSDGIDAFIELGPHRVLSQAVEQVAASSAHHALAVACGRRESPELAAAFGVIAALWTHGVAIGWARVLGWRGCSVALPLYPWQRERFWAEAAELTETGTVGARRTRLSPQAQRALHVLEWHPLPAAVAPVGDRSARWLVVASTQADGEPVAAALRARGQSATVVHSMQAAGELVREWPVSNVPTGVVVLPPDEVPAAYSPVAALNALRASLGTPASAAVPRVWWTTVGAHVVAGHASSLHCEQGGALWGAARVLAEEYPQSWGGLIDLDPASDPEGRAAQIAMHLVLGGDEDQVAFRGELRYALRLVPASAHVSAPFPWRADAAYLLTGAFGGVSLQLAHGMVRDGVRRLVLLGRTAMPPRHTWAALDPESRDGRRAAAVRALEHAGAAVHLLHADVADERAVRAAIDAYNAEGWPSIDGVIHNAAVLANRLSHEMTPGEFEEVLAPKLTGAVVLDRVFPSLSLFVLSSSMSAYWAPPGMANYAAANAGVDALAAARRARGQHAISVQWCPWADVGMHDAANMEHNFGEMAKLGVRSITGDEGVGFFNNLISRPDSVISVLPITWSTYRSARRGRDLPLFRAIADAAPQPDDAATGSGALRQLLEASTVDRKPLLDSLVRSVVAGVLRRPAAQLDERQPFGAMGVDSLLALEIRNRLESALERPLTATLAWNFPTVQSLVAHLDALLVPRVVANAITPPVEPSGDLAPSDFAGILALTDSDALLALRRRR